MEKDNNLVILMGTSCSGKSSIAEELSKKGFKNVELDKLIREIYNKGNHELNGEEIKRAYEIMGKRTNEFLKENDVVVGEWFYIDGCYDWFISQVSDSENNNILKFIINIERDDLIKRISSYDEITKNIVLKNFDLTYNQPSKYYKDPKIQIIHTKDRCVESLVSEIVSYIDFKNKLRNE